jgi:hypothetical protein
LIHIKPLSRTNANTPGTICSRNEAGGRGRLVALMERPQKITLADMRASGVRGLLIYCSDYHCSHWTAISGDRWPDDVRLSDLEPRFTCQACGKRGADVRAIILAK